MIVIRADFGCEFLLLLLPQKHLLSVLCQSLFSTRPVHSFTVLLEFILTLKLPAAQVAHEFPMSGMLQHVQLQFVRSAILETQDICS